MVKNVVKNVCSGSLKKRDRICSGPYTKGYYYFSSYLRYLSSQPKNSRFQTTEFCGWNT